jgi:hypothetical protein
MNRRRYISSRHNKGVKSYHIIKSSKDRKEKNRKRKRSIFPKIRLKANTIYTIYRRKMSSHVAINMELAEQTAISSPSPPPSPLKSKQEHR